ncbi:hypothetical protein BH09VER1_BH09VER1_43620 [soil metagenome]
MTTPNWKAVLKDLAFLALGILLGGVITGAILIKYDPKLPTLLSGQPGRGFSPRELFIADRLTTEMIKLTPDLRARGVNVAEYGDRGAMLGGIGRHNDFTVTQDWWYRVDATSAPSPEAIVSATQSCLNEIVLGNPSIALRITKVSYDPTTHLVTINLKWTNIRDK